MEGAMAADKMTFSALDAVNNVPILASSTVFYVLELGPRFPDFVVVSGVLATIAYVRTGLREIATA